jgi:hypothetical protein
MKIGLLTSWLSQPGGGVTAALAPLARDLEAQGVSVSVFGLADSCEGLRGDGWGRVSVQTAPPLPPRAFGYAPGLAGLLKRSCPDLIHVHGLWMYSSLASLRWSNHCQRAARHQRARHARSLGRPALGMEEARRRRLV